MIISEALTVILYIQCTIAAIYPHWRKMTMKTLQRIYLIGNLVSIALGFLSNLGIISYPAIIYLISSIIGSKGQKGGKA